MPKDREVKRDKGREYKVLGVMNMFSILTDGFTGLQVKSELILCGINMQNLLYISYTPIIFEKIPKRDSKKR